MGRYLDLIAQREAEWERIKTQGPPPKMFQKETIAPRAKAVVTIADVFDDDWRRDD